MFRPLIFATVFVSACSSPPITKSAAPPCLNIQDGDLHIELSRNNLIVGDGNGAAKSLDLGAIAKCEKLELVQKAQTPAVAIRYTTEQNESKLAMASIKSGKWLLAPTLLMRRVGSRTTEIKRAEWSTDSSDHALLRLTDPLTGEYTVVRP